MIDLNAMRLPEADQHRDAVKTFLTPEARARVKAAAAYTGRPEYAIIEAAIMSAIMPFPAPAGADIGEGTAQ
jgi:hypothetical protein